MKQSKPSWNPWRRKPKQAGSPAPTAGAECSLGFTVIELLAVVTIVGVMAVVSLPAMVGLSKSARGASALGITMSGVDQARNQAISSGTPSYLVLTTTDTVWPKDYRGRAFGVFSESFLPASESYTQFQVGKWTILPDGVCFKPDPETVYGATGSPLTTVYFSPLNQMLPIVAVKFNSLGAIEQPTDPANARIRLFTGVIGADGNVVETSKAGANGEYNIRLAYSTGRCFRDEPRVGASPAPANP